MAENLNRRSQLRLYKSFTDDYPTNITCGDTGDVTWVLPGEDNNDPRKQLTIDGSLKGPFGVDDNGNVIVVNLADRLVGIDSGISLETTRAMSAEGVLEANITNLTTRLTTAEVAIATLTARLDALTA